MAGEKINLPRWRAEEKRGIHVRFQPLSFPDQRFRVKMEWNSILETWNIEIIHDNRDNKLVTKSFATIYRIYEYEPWMYFYFADPSGRAVAITPENLGDEVNLYGVPAEDGRPTTEWEQ